MSFNYKYILLFLSLLFVSCKKDAASNETPISKEILWQNMERGISGLTAASSPTIFEDVIIYGWNQYLPNSESAPIIAYDKLSGQKIWGWDEYFSNNFIKGGGYPVLKFNDNFIFATDKEIYAINTLTGQTIWSVVEQGQRTPALRKLDNHFYSVLKDTDTGNSIIQKGSLLTGNIENIFSMENIYENGTTKVDIKVIKKFFSSLLFAQNQKKYNTLIINNL